jgi:bifunctional UDP-N-acetylglucosamine pyrophosphorylase/glucosamine-1-phosphate N-acetyltransferase
MNVPERALVVVIMAAGKGTRMKNPEMAKVMFPVGGLPMIHHVVERAIASGASRVICIIGHNRESVRAYLVGAFDARVEFAEQLEQLGTGHAVMQAIPLLDGFDGDVMVLSGDVPMLSEETSRALAGRHRSGGASATVLSVTPPDPFGLGRIVRGEDGSVERIVEEKDASQEERGIREVNSGIYIFNAADLVEALGGLDNDNAQKEYYLTDVIGRLKRSGRKVDVFVSPDHWEVQGVNTVDQLADVDAEFARRMEASQQ